MTDNPSLSEYARGIRSQLGELWTRVNKAADAGSLTDAQKAEIQRELAELARIPWDIAESLGGCPDETLGNAAVDAHSRMRDHFGLPGAPRSVVDDHPDHHAVVVQPAERLLSGPPA